MRRLIVFAAVLCGALMYGSLVSQNWPLRMDNNFVLYGQSAGVPPVLSSLSTTSGMKGSTVSVVMAGSGFSNSSFSTSSGISLTNNVAPSVAAINVKVVDSTVMTADLVIPAGGAPRTVFLNVTTGSMSSVASLPFEITPGPTCEVSLNGSSYSNGQDVIAQSLLISNPTASGIPVEFKYWIAVPGGSLMPFASGGHDGSVILPPGMVQEVGPLTLGTVQANYPRGLYTFGCKFINPASGNVVTQTNKPFSLQ